MVKNIEEKLSDSQGAIEKAKLSWQEACSKETNFSQEIWKKKEAWYKEQELNGITTLNYQKNSQQNSQRPPVQENHFRKPRASNGKGQRGFGPFRNNNQRPNREGYTEEKQHQFRNPSVNTRTPKPVSTQTFVTDFIMGNHPQQIPRTLSDSFLNILIKATANNDS